MSHHISNTPGLLAETDQMRVLRQEMERAMKEKELGATGRFPRGKLCNEDEGEILIGISCDMRTATVLMNFGKPVTFIGFTAEQAIDIAEFLQKRADEVRGRKN